MILDSSQGPLFFALPPVDKMVSQDFLRKVSQDSERQRDDFAQRFTDEQHPAWRRYVDGIYNHPKTWWIGIIMGRNDAKQKHPFDRQLSLVSCIN